MNASVILRSSLGVEAPPLLGGSLAEAPEGFHPLGVAGEAVGVLGEEQTHTLEADTYCVQADTYCVQGEP